MREHLKRVTWDWGLKQASHAPAAFSVVTAGGRQAGTRAHKGTFS